MEILKIIGIGFLTLIITIIFKEYKKEYAIYSILVGGAIIIFYSMGTIKSIIEFVQELSLKSDYNNTSINFVGDGISPAQLCNFCIDKFNADKSNFESSKEEFCSYLNIENLGIAGFTKFINTNKIGENILPLYLKKPQAQIQLEAKLKGNI